MWHGAEIPGLQRFGAVGLRSVGFKVQGEGSELGGLLGALSEPNKGLGSDNASGKGGSVADPFRDPSLGLVCIFAVQNVPLGPHSQRSC